MDTEEEVQEVLLTIFFEGTSNQLSPATTQIGEFAAATEATDLAWTGIEGPPTPSDTRTKGPFKLCFDGCGVTNGVAGTLFAAGLDGQCALVADTVRRITSAAPPVGSCAKKKVRCVAVGLSRGGIACLKLALVLSAGDLVELCSLHLLVFDPVPGNMLSTGFPFTAIKTRDLSGCSNLRSVLALYPHEPLPDSALHAPLLPRYPAACHVEEDVTLGCHQGALYATSARPRGWARAANLSCNRITRFLESLGVQLRFECGATDLTRFRPDAHDCLILCREELAKDEPTVRALHDGRNEGRRIVRRKLDEVAPPARPGTNVYLNRHHEQLERELSGAAGAREDLLDAAASVKHSTTIYMLSIDGKRPSDDDLGCSRVS